MKHISSIKIVRDCTYVHVFLENKYIYYFECTSLYYVNSGYAMYYKKYNTPYFLKKGCIDFDNMAEKKVFKITGNISHSCENIEDVYQIICDVLFVKILEKL